jgi:vanillate O-demethylase monooxygenase subunit
MWLRDCWYVIAWDHEIPAADSDELFTRIVLGEPILVLRTADGGFAVLADRCCHRPAPLSNGRREGDGVRCGYHGMAFDARSRCIEAPGTTAIPEKACVRPYPVAVRNRPGYLHHDTPYLLICDNLLDFSHLSYVHAPTLGGSTAIAEARPEITRIDGPGMPGIRVVRRVPNVPAPPFHLRMRAFDGPLDRWFDDEFLLPGTLLMHSGGRPAGRPEGDDRDAVRLHSCQTLTPGTETTTHYFSQQSHPAGHGDERLTESIFQSLIGAFNEDRDMITAQHHDILLAPDAPMVPIPIDGALVQFRRLLAERLDAERARSREPGIGPR